MIKLKANMTEFTFKYGYHTELHIDGEMYDGDKVADILSSESNTFIDYDNLDDFFTENVRSNRVRNIGDTFEYNNTISFSLVDIDINGYAIQYDDNGIFYGNLVWVPIINGKEQNWYLDSSFGAIGSISI